MYVAVSAQALQRSGAQQTSRSGSRLFVFLVHALADRLRGDAFYIVSFTNMVGFFFSLEGIITCVFCGSGGVVFSCCKTACTSRFLLPPLSKAHLC